MARLLALPPPSPQSALGPKARLGAFLLQTWPGRLLLGALAVLLLGRLWGLPHALSIIATLIVCVHAVVAAIRLLRYVLRALLWRIRSKLIVSYLFIALVPVLLLTLLFFLAGVIGVLFVAAHLVGEEMAGIGRSLTTTSEVALAGLPADDRAAAAAFEVRLSPTRRRYPGLGATLLRHGHVVAHWGAAPQALPAWWKQTDFAGLAGEGEGVDVFRTVCVRGESAVLLDLPLDTALYAPLEERSGIHVLGRNEIPKDLNQKENASPIPGTIPMISFSRIFTAIRARIIFGKPFRAA